jgi:AcrR family transcriptional regulator
MATALNENDPRVKRTRELLLQSFRELAEQRTMHTISVQDIADRATVNRATFYAHFQDKDAIMDAAFRGLIQQALTANLSPSSKLTGENIRLLFGTLRDFLNTTVRRCARTGDGPATVKSAVQEELYGFLLEWLSRALPAQSACRRHNPSALATLLSWALFGAAVEWTWGRSKESKAVAEEVVEMVIERATGSGD